MRLNLVRTAECAYADAAKEMVSKARFIKAEVLPALKKTEGGEKAAEAVAALVNPAADSVENAAFAVLGTMLHLIEAAPAGENGALTIQVDAELVAELRAVAGMLAK